jgi:hypothetical protein
LNGQIALRSVTPQDQDDYALVGVEKATGLKVIGIGEPAYLEAWANIAIPPANIVGVTWALTAKPPGSAAALAASPLGAKVPIDRPSERLVSQVAGRRLLVPDAAGQYVVSVTIETSTNGVTNLSQTITASTYMGINTCSLCHSGGQIASNKVLPWSKTLHATRFTRGINGETGTNYSAADLEFHTVGFNTATNGGFDEIAQLAGWTVPETLNSNNWSAVPASVKNLANIQCESCHGPGSEHAFSLGNTNRIAVSFNAGLCGQCHDNVKDANASKVATKVTEWKNSGHAIAPRQTGPTCVRCHTAKGFGDFIDGKPGVTTAFEAISCAACHEPHDATNPHQLRSAPLYTLPDGTHVTTAGLGALCMQCHHSRNGSAEANIVNYQLGKPTWAGGSSFGVHRSPQGDMVEGVNAITYGKEIPSGSHAAAITNVCVACHMQHVEPTDPAFGQAGGHTFSMTYNTVSGGVTNTIDKVDVCVKCHGPISSFDFARKDYDGDGVIEGVQTEVQKLLNRLSTLLPSGTYVASGNYIADGLVKTSVSVKTNWPVKFLNAAYNWQFVSADGSKGVHNAPFAVGLLKTSIADLTGDANTDGLPDAWQVQYFGTSADPKAAPNWLKYNLGLDPRVPGITVPGGVVWVNGTDILNSTDKLAIYTAAEVAFDTVAGTSYQIQGISMFGGEWQNIGAPIAGNGSTISYVTPTRQGVQQFFRVIHNP